MNTRNGRHQLAKQKDRLKWNAQYKKNDSPPHYDQPSDSVINNTIFEPHARGRAWSRLSNYERAAFILMLASGSILMLRVFLYYYNLLALDEDVRCGKGNHVPPSKYMNIPVTVLPEHSMSNCEPKLTGAIGGKICDVKDGSETVKYIMKVTGPNTFFPKTDTALHTYNARIVKLIGAVTPETKLFYHKNGTAYNAWNNKVVCNNLFHASKWMKEAESFTKFSERISVNHQRGLYGKDNALSLEAIIRSELYKEIGEKGIAQLAVSSTFIDDLIGNGDNWGIANHSLVIFDMDLAPGTVEGFKDYPNSFDEDILFYFTATRMPEVFSWRGIYFSLDTIKIMKEIFNHLSKHCIVPLHPSVDIPNEKFNQFARAYENACACTIQEIQADSKLKYLKTNTPDSAINSLLKNNLIAELDHLKRERTQRYGSAGLRLN